MPQGTIDPSSASYAEYEQDQQYDYDPGLIVLPVAGPTAAFKKVRLHGGLGRRVVAWKANKAGKPPIVPSMTNAGSDTFLGGHINLAASQNPQAAGYNWSAAGVYTYVQSAPRIVGVDTFNAGAKPYSIAPNDTLAAGLSGPGLAAAAGQSTDRARTHEFAKAVSPTAEDRADDTYIWPFTLLPPVFSNDFLIGG